MKMTTLASEAAVAGEEEAPRRPGLGTAWERPPRHWVAMAAVLAAAPRASE